MSYHFVFITTLNLEREVLGTFEDWRKRNHGYRSVLLRYYILLQVYGLLIPTWKLLTVKKEKRYKSKYNNYVVWRHIMFIIIVWKVSVKWTNRSVKHKTNIQGGVICKLIEKKKITSKALGKSRKSENLCTIVLQRVEEHYMSVSVEICFMDKLCFGEESLKPRSLPPGTVSPKVSPTNSEDGVVFNIEFKKGSSLHGK